MKDIDTMLEADGTVTNILDRVLDIAKLDAGEYPVQQTWFQPMPALLEHTRNNGEACVKDSVTFALGTDDNLTLARLRIKSDRTILSQVVDNLVSNPAKYTKTGSVNVFAGLKGEGVSRTLTISVSDTGRGLTKEELIRVLKPFAQIRTSSDQKAGTGLGLPLACAMVKSLGGELTLSSCGVGLGATATARVPVEVCFDHVRKHARPDDIFHALLWQKGRRILIADDGVLNRRIMERLCHKFNIECVSVCDGEDAVQKVNEGGEFAVVILDMEMERVNGDIACQQLRDGGYKGYIVLLSGNGYTSNNERKRLFDIGFDVILSKMGKPGLHQLLKACKDRET